MQVGDKVRVIHDLFVNDKNHSEFLGKEGTVSQIVENENVLTVSVLLDGAQLRYMFSPEELEVIV